MTNQVARKHVGSICLKITDMLKLYVSKVQLFKFHVVTMVWSYGLVRLSQKSSLLGCRQYHVLPWKSSFVATNTA